jgi:predicted deacylase
MAVQRSLVSVDVDFESAGIQRGHMRVPHSHDGSAYGHIAIPILVARGSAGPTVLLTAGVHGDEYEGPLALARLIRALRPERLKGRIIVVPALNFPAHLAGTRTSPIDTLNLNRRFPGDRNGSPTDMIAHYVETELLPRADYCFDFHAGGTSLDYLPTLIAQPPRSAKRRALQDRLVAAFQPPRLLYMDMLGEDRTIAAAAERHGVFFMTGEFGGGARVSPEGLDLLVRGLRRMMVAIGVLDGEPADVPVRPVRTLSVKGAAHYLFASRPGIFEPCFRLGDEARRGRVAGYIHEPLAPWKDPAEIRFAGDGIVLCMRALARVAPGDCLGHLASDVD